ncbi:MAG: chromosomal replication initiator protein DnaA [Treponema sp.]|nr:chromosomal replication initiator protein DnaA [Treponema sp.]
METETYRAIFNRALEEIHDEYKEKNKEDDFKLYFNLTYINDHQNTIAVSVPSEFLWQQMTSKGYIKEVIKKIEVLSGQKNIDLRPVIAEIGKSAESDSRKKPSEKIAITQKPEKKKPHPQLRSDFIFETFVPGENNNFAYLAAFAVAKEPGKQAGRNPLLFYGGSGLGKTHLMESIGNYIYENSPEPLKICYISAESFTNEFTASLTAKKADQFKSKYRNLDVLLIDDIHFLQGKAGTQEELFYTFNALRDANKQIVFTCDRPIKELKEFSERMQSRLSSGTSIDMNPPNYETRRAILQKKLELQKKDIPPEVIDYIAQNVETNVRDLEAALNKMIGYAEIVQKPLTIDIAQEQLRDIFTVVSTENISIEIIQKVIADFYNISVSDINKPKRAKKFVIPRHIAIYICREMTEYSYTEIGQEFGGRDHSTIMHSYEKINEQLKTDSTLAMRIQQLMREIKNYKK